MSGDGPIKIAPPSPPEAAPLDEIILGDDDDAAARPHATRPSARPERLDGSVPPATPRPLEKFDPNRDRATDTKKRAKLTLRIPDDEVSRPQLPATTPMGGIPIASSPTPSRPASRPEEDFRIMPVASPDDTLELPNKAPKAPGIDADVEAGWTPFAPEVGSGLSPRPVAVAVAEDSGPITPTKIEEINDAPMRPSYPSAPISEEIPVALDLSEEDEEDELTNPRLPVALDSEEIKIDEGERLTDPDAPEVEAEDLVSVESIPSPGRAAAKEQAAFGSRFSEAKEAKEGKASAALSTSAKQSQSGVTTPRVQETPAPVMARPEPKELHFATSSSGQLAPPPMSDLAANRKKTRPWWEELFGDDYIRTMAKVTDSQITAEATFIEESLGCEAGAMILDLACGTGRHAVELAARGYQVVGYDLSLAMLARASDEAQERGEKINFVQGDMREMTFEDTFDGVFSWNTSFGFFDEEKNAAVVARVHKSLKKGGQFLLDVINRDYLARMAPSLAWFEGDGCICMDEMQMDFISSRMKVKRTLMMDDGRTKEIEYSIRVYSLHELGKLLHDNGFRVAEVSGRTERRASSSVLNPRAC